MFIDKLKKLMAARGLNKNSFSRQSGIPYTTIVGLFKKGYENTKLSTLKQIANFFDVSLDYLVFDNPNEFSIEENQLITDYRTLDKYGQEAVTNTIMTEKKRCEDQSRERNIIPTKQSHPEKMFIAARSADDTPPRMVDYDEDLIQRLKQETPVTSEDEL